jgi:NTP pyrophosphohydrolases including oxidative damage repair enzymes
MEKQIKRSLIYDGQIISVYKDEVLIEENNTTALREVIKHQGSVAIVALKNDCILLIKQYRYAIGKYVLEIPAGKLEKEENHLECASRELEEETGYQGNDFKEITSMVPSVGYCNEEIKIYITNNITKVSTPLDCDADEFIEVIELNINEAYQLVKEGKIIDAKTIIGIMFAKEEYFNQ